MLTGTGKIMCKHSKGKSEKAKNIDFKDYYS